MTNTSSVYLNLKEDSRGAFRTTGKSVPSVLPEGEPIVDMVLTSLRCTATATALCTRYNHREGLLKCALN